MLNSDALREVIIMCTYHQARYFHYKPPYPVSGYCYCGNGRNKDSISISMKVPMQGATIKKEEPQSALVIPCPDAAPAPSALRNESGPGMSAAIPGSAASPAPIQLTAGGPCGRIPPQRLRISRI